MTRGAPLKSVLKILGLMFLSDESEVMLLAIVEKQGCHLGVESRWSVVERKAILGILHPVAGVATSDHRLARVEGRVLVC
jgi:hypothetical protein